jgi:hypothetical protein
MFCIAPFYRTSNVKYTNTPLKLSPPQVTRLRSLVLRFKIQDFLHHTTGRTDVSDSIRSVDQDQDTGRPKLWPSIKGKFRNFHDLS